jgi:hypothetical protein
VTAIVLGLRFPCEMAALAAVAYWGQRAARGVPGIVLAAIAVPWWPWSGDVPRAQAAAGSRPAGTARDRAGGPGGRELTLWSAGQPTLAVVLLVVAVVTGAINARTAATKAPA